MRWVVQKFWISYVAVALIYSAFSLGPIVKSVLNTPPDRTYIGLDDYPLDMTGNMAIVWQSYHGAWMRTSHFVNAADGPVGPGTILKFEYIVIGKIAKFMQADPYLTFYFSRIVLALIHFVVIYLLIVHIIKNYWLRLGASLIIFFGSGITPPGMPLSENPTNLMVIEAATMFRMYFGAHQYILGSITALLSLIFISKTLLHPKNILFFCSAVVFGLLTSWVYAPNTVLLVTTFPFFLGLQLLRYKKMNMSIITQAAILFCYAIIALIPVVAIKLTLSGVWDWSAYDKTEKIVPFVLSPYQYLLVMGTAYIASWFAVKKSLQSNNYLLQFFSTWLIVHPISTFVIRNMLEINMIRYFLSMYFIIFGILAAVGIGQMADWFKQYKRVVIIILITIVLIPSIITINQVYYKNFACFCIQPGFDYGYPRKTIMQGINWLRYNTRPTDKVLTLFYAGTLIPAFSGNTVYANWWFRLAQHESYDVVMVPVVSFFEGSLADDAAIEFLRRNNISYVFQDIEERGVSTTQPSLPYTFLTKVFSNDDVTIYRFVE